MQLMRTSLRHLRLSKLQKEKVKQGKMWDFTVRGWREADISGMEDLFAEKETAATSQKAVSSLQYPDIKIGKCVSTREVYTDIFGADQLLKHHWLSHTT